LTDESCCGADLARHFASHWDLREPVAELMQGRVQACRGCSEEDTAEL